MRTKNGSCGCGEINYSVDADPISIINCHCNMCRAHNGSAFTSYVIVPEEYFSITKGNDKLTHYTKDNATKHFCENCGTPLFNRHKEYENIRLIYLGTLTDNKQYIPNANTWCKSQLNWVPEINKIKNILDGS